MNLMITNMNCILRAVRRMIDEGEIMIPLLKNPN